MTSVRDELIRYGQRTAQAGLVAGAGGNVSARDGDSIWMKPELAVLPNGHFPGRMARITERCSVANI